jgi:hypothetical protein
MITAKNALSRLELLAQAHTAFSTTASAHTALIPASAQATKCIETVKHLCLLCHEAITAITEDNEEGSPALHAQLYADPLVLTLIGTADAPVEYAYPRYQEEDFFEFYDDASLEEGYERVMAILIDHLASVLFLRTDSLDSQEKQRIESNNDQFNDGDVEVTDCFSAHGTSIHDPSTEESGVDDIDSLDYYGASYALWYYQPYFIEQGDIVNLDEGYAL